MDRKTNLISKNDLLNENASQKDPKTDKGLSDVKIKNNVSNYIYQWFYLLKIAFIVVVNFRRCWRAIFCVHPLLLKS